MASITIRNIDEETKRRLRIRAAQKDRSMEEEARDVLNKSVGAPPKGESLAAIIRAIVDPIGAIELELPERTSQREPPDFNSPDFGE
jgi:plasmid stability protein